MKRRLVAALAGLVLVGGFFPTAPAKANHKQPEIAAAMPGTACLGWTYKVAFLMIDGHYGTPYSLDVDYNVDPGPVGLDRLYVQDAYTGHIEYDHHRWNNLGLVSWLVQGENTDPNWFQPDKGGATIVRECGIRKLAPVITVIRNSVGATAARLGVQSHKDDTQAHQERLIFGDGHEQTIEVPARYQNGQDTGPYLFTEVEHHYEFTHPDYQRSENEPTVYLPAVIRADGESDFGYPEQAVTATCY